MAILLYLCKDKNYIAKNTATDYQPRTASFEE